MLGKTVAFCSSLLIKSVSFAVLWPGLLLNLLVLLRKKNGLGPLASSFTLCPEFLLLRSFDILISLGGSCTRMD